MASIGAQNKKKQDLAKISLIRKNEPILGIFR